MVNHNSIFTFLKVRLGTAYEAVQLEIIHFDFVKTNATLIIFIIRSHSSKPRPNISITEVRQYRSISAHCDSVPCKINLTYEHLPDTGPKQTETA